jgi:hypothetical protein
MKKIAISIFVLLLMVGIIVLKDDIDYNNSFNNNSDQWITYSKDQNKIISRPTSLTDLKKIGADSTKEKNIIPKRVLSSVQNKAKTYKRFKGRRILGNIKNQDFDKINFINSTTIDWKNKLSEKLLKHRTRKAKLLIKSEKSVIKVQNGSARYLELVAVTFLFKGDDSNSFKAFVDSETGEVLQTWSQSIHDKVGSKEIRLTPDGIL